MRAQGSSGPATLPYPELAYAGFRLTSQHLSNPFLERTGGEKERTPAE